MIGIGLLGARFAAEMQLIGWRRVPNARVVGIWNRTAPVGRAVASRFDVPFYDDLEALLGCPEVDAIDVATAPTSHLELVARAAKAGKHVLCQKPMAMNYAEAQALVAACTEAGVRLMVNENFRWRAWYRAAYRVLQEGSLGRLFHLHLSYRRGNAIVTPQQPEDRIFEREPFVRVMQPLILLTMGTHYLDVIRYLFGDPQSVYARLHKVTPYVAGEEVATVLIGYGDRTALLDVSWASAGYPGLPQPDTLVVEGLEGSLFLGSDGQVRVRYRDGREQTIACEMEDWHQASWTAALAHFADCLERGVPFETEGAHNLETLRLVFAGYESAASGAPVAVGRA